MSSEMEQLFPEIYNPVPDAPTNTVSPYNKSPYNSFNYGVNMWSPLNQWFDENRASYDEKLQGIGGLLGEGAGVLGAYLTGMENPMDLLNMATNDSGTDNTNQTQDNDNVNQNDNVSQTQDNNMSVANQVTKPSYSTQGWYGGHSGGGLFGNLNSGWYGGQAAGGQTVENNNQTVENNTGNLVEIDPLTSVANQYGSGPDLFSFQTVKDLFNLSGGGLGFGAQDYDDIDYDALMIQSGGTAGGYGS